MRADRPRGSIPSLVPAVAESPPRQPSSTPQLCQHRLHVLLKEAVMKLEGLHHITMITADAPRTVGFYTGVLGLGLAKKTVYHLYFGDETGAAGSILTWFEDAGAPRGRSGAGMMHTIQLGVPSVDAHEFWASRLAEKGYASRTYARSVRFDDWEGLWARAARGRRRQPVSAGRTPRDPYRVRNRRSRRCSGLRSRRRCRGDRAHRGGGVHAPRCRRVPPRRGAAPPLGLRPVNRGGRPR